MGFLALLMLGCLVGGDIASLIMITMAFLLMLNPIREQVLNRFSVPLWAFTVASVVILFVGPGVVSSASKPPEQVATTEDFQNTSSDEDGAPGVQPQEQAVETPEPTAPPAAAAIVDAKTIFWTPADKLDKILGKLTNKSRYKGDEFGCDKSACENRTYIAASGIQYEFLLTGNTVNSLMISPPKGQYGKDKIEALLGDGVSLIKSNSGSREYAGIPGADAISVYFDNDGYISDMYIRQEY